MLLVNLPLKLDILATLGAPQNIISIHRALTLFVVFVSVTTNFYHKLYTQVVVCCVDLIALRQSDPRNIQNCEPRSGEQSEKQTSIVTSIIKHILIIELHPPIIYIIALFGNVMVYLCRR